MKTLLLKPGFELIFALSFIGILGLPPMLMAQANKSTDINIVNGDTTVNGKNIKELSPADRQEALKDISRMSSQMNNDSGNRKFFFKRRDTVYGRVQHMHFDRRRSDLDSLGNMSDGKPDNLRRNYNFAFKYRNDAEPNMGFRERNFNRSEILFERRNSQNFDYATTDRDGLNTHVRFHVSEVSNEDLKKMPPIEGGRFEISDLNLVPEFSTGKTLLMFNLPAKTVAEVKVTNSAGKVLLNERATGGSFSKKFVLGLNGVYYLQVKQGHNISVKKIVKEG